MAEKMSLEVAQGLLTEEEIAALLTQARDGVLADRKKLAEKVVLAELKEQQRRALGVVTGDEAKDETVWIWVDLPEYTNHVLIDGRAFFHNMDYPVPRHQASYILELCQRAHDHQAEVDGKGAMAARRNRTGIVERNSGTTVGGKGAMQIHNAPTRTQ